MRLPRVRFTVRCMMVAVAVVAVVFGGVHLRQRANLYREKARQHAQMESIIAAVYALSIPPDPQLAPLNAARHTYHAAMRAKYDRAASRPWEYVPPDPPEPGWSPAVYVAPDPPDVYVPPEPLPAPPAQP